MSNHYDDEIPPSTLPGGRDKFQATLTADGRYVIELYVNTTPIAEWPAPLRDPKPLVHEPGPPSIVDIILSGLDDAAARDRRRLERGEITGDEAVAAIKARHGALKDNPEYQADVERRKIRCLQGFFDAGELITAQALCGRLDISLQELERALRDYRMFSVPGPSGETWYPAFFADPYRLEVERVSVTLGNLDGLLKWQFFTEPRWLLGGDTGIISLQLENYGYVMTAAKQFRESSTSRQDGD
jgi:hypothetical protein